MAASKRDERKVVVDRLTDVAEWGDKECHSGMYSEPFKVAGETVDIDSLPEFGDSGDPNANKDARAPLAPAGTP